MAKWCIGIDLGGTFIKFVALDAGRKPTETFQLPTPDRADRVIEQMVTGARSVMDRHALAAADIVGVGIGSPGPLDISSGVIIAMPNIPGMEDVPIRDEVAAALDLPGVLENDANAAAYGEYLCGAGASGGSMVLLTLGTGLGSGIIVDGKILHGSHEIGAEFGHMIVVPDGELCPCGQRGCLERYCSAANVARRAQHEVEVNGRESRLKDALAERGGIDAQDVNTARKAGDKLAGEIWDQAAYYLALACVNICRIFDPKEIVFGGGMARAGEDLMHPLRERFQALHWSLTKPMTRLAVAKLGNDAGAIGAAGVAWQKFGDGIRESDAAQ